MLSYNNGRGESLCGEIVLVIDSPEYFMTVEGSSEPGAEEEGTGVLAEY